MDIALANLLYHPTQKVLDMTLKIKTLLDNNNKTTIQLPIGTKISNIQAVSIEQDIQGHGILLLHWKPNFHISTQRDPFCSALILKYNSLCKLHRIIENIITQNNTIGNK